MSEKRKRVGGSWKSRREDFVLGIELPIFRLSVNHFRLLHIHKKKLKTRSDASPQRQFTSLTYNPHDDLGFLQLDLAEQRQDAVDDLLLLETAQDARHYVHENARVRGAVLEGLQ